MRHWLLGISLACLPLLAAADSHLTHCSIQTHNKQTQITLRTTKPTTYHTFTLTTPPRLVIDLDQTQTNKNPCHFINAGSLISRVRTGEPDLGVLRLVFDLKKPTAKLTLHHHPSHNSQAINFTLSSPENTHTLTRAQQAAQPLWPHMAKQQIIPPHYQERVPQRLVIVIDPGHGGKDPGATGVRGYHEKNIVLSIAKRLKRILNKKTPYHAILTRNGDHYLTLRERLKFARDHHASLFISVHADAFHRGRAHGASVYALSERGASSEAAHWLASKENDSELLGGVSLDDKTMTLRSVLIDLSQSASVRESMDLGKDILRELDGITKLHHNRVEEAAFVVLKSPDIPSLLIETGFLSNPREERSLVRSSYQERLALAISRGITRYIRTQKTQKR